MKSAAPTSPGFTPPFRNLVGQGLDGIGVAAAQARIDCRCRAPASATLSQNIEHERETIAPSRVAAMPVGSNRRHARGNCSINLRWLCAPVSDRSVVAARC